LGFEKGGRNFSSRRIKDESKIGLDPEVRKRPVIAQQKNRMKMSNPTIASRFCLNRSQNSWNLVRFGGSGAST
jgi:hypothetical protein